jgi:hypothetical protein
MEKMPIPEGLDVSQAGDAVVISRSWRNLGAIPLFFFLVFWFGFLGVWYYIAFTTHAPLMMFLFPLVHLAVGVGLAYFAVSSLVNQTDVIISTSRVKCITRPLPWRGNQDLPAGDIRGVTVRERWGNRGSVRYALMYVDTANKEHTLLASMARREQADFIAASIQEILGLQAQTA